MEDTQKKQGVWLNRQTLQHLEVTRRWTLFLSAVGFLVIVVILAIGAFVGSSFSLMSPYYSVPGELILGFYLIVGVLYLIPVYHLARFSAHTKKAIAQESTERAEKAFRHLKRMFISFGLLSIIILIIYPIILVGAYLSFLPKF